jgi:hypothetical protein
MPDLPDIIEIGYSRSKLMRAANHAVGVDGIVLNPSGLQVDAPDLFEVCNAYRAAYGRK